MMDYIKVFKDGDLCEIIGVYCNFAISEIIIMSEEFETHEPEDIGIKKDGLHILKPIFNEPEYFNGGLVNGSWYDFKSIDYRCFDEHERDAYGNPPGYKPSFIANTIVEVTKRIIKDNKND